MRIIDPVKKLSILIPVRNEEMYISSTVISIKQVVEAAGINYEIIIINDGSIDRTELILQQIVKENSQIQYFNQSRPNGFGLAIKKGLHHYTGDAVAIVMADMSDSPVDIIKYYDKLNEGYECVFGSRFIRGSCVSGYPLHKFILNRVVNNFIKIFFLIQYNDTTNAFKCYRRNVVDGVRPLLSYHFELTVEIPLKAIVRGYRYAVVPISWTQRKKGMAKFKISEIGSRYLSVIFCVLWEKLFYRKAGVKL